MKFRMIVFIVIFGLATWLPVIARQNTAPQPASS